MKRHAIWFVLFCCIAACQEKHTFSVDILFNENQWFSKDSLVGRFDIQDTSAIYQIGLDLAHGLDYGYQNVYVQIETIFPSGHKKKQELSFNLADKSGIWYGKCRRDKCKVRVILQEKALFKETGSHTFVIRPFMRKDPVPSVIGASFFVNIM